MYGPRVTPIDDAVLRDLTPADAGHVTVLQRCCWVEEAIANQMWSIPPLTESVEDVAGWLASTTALGLWLDGRLLAMVRGVRTGDTWEVGRLAVVPDLRGRHLGDWMLDRIEERVEAGCTRYELFTGARSERNLVMYERRGYRHIGELRPGIVLMEKPVIG